MRSGIDRVAQALLMGRPHSALAIELAFVFLVASAACFAACAFMALEPLS